MKVTRDQIDPELRLAGLAAQLLSVGRPVFFRLMYRLSRRAAGQNVTGLACAERRIPSLDGAPEVRVRLFRPASGAGDRPLAGVLFLHGGGYAFGCPELFGPTYQMLMRTRACVIIAPTTASGSTHRTRRR